jgi:hypothetical protein
LKELAVKHMRGDPTRVGTRTVAGKTLEGVSPRKLHRLPASLLVGKSGLQLRVKTQELRVAMPCSNNSRCIIRGKNSRWVLEDGNILEPDSEARLRRANPKSAVGLYGTH